MNGYCSQHCICAIVAKEYRPSAFVILIICSNLAVLIILKSYGQASCGNSIIPTAQMRDRCTPLKTSFMQKIFIALILCLTLIVSCSKSDVSPTNAVVGTWIFTNQLTNSFAYPSVLTNPFSVGNTSWSTTFDSIKITFDNNGSYTFWNFHLPVDNGKYSIAQDSFIIIKPDTADFVKFNYSLPLLTGGTGIPPILVYSPYSNFHFSSDTILFKKSTSNNIVFSGAWLTKATYPIIPSNDTLILNQSLNYFKRE